MWRFTETGTGLLDAPRTVQRQCRRHRVGDLGHKMYSCRQTMTAMGKQIRRCTVTERGISLHPPILRAPAAGTIESFRIDHQTSVEVAGATAVSKEMISGRYQPSTLRRSYETAQPYANN